VELDKATGLLKEPKDAGLAGPAPSSSTAEKILKRVIKFRKPAKKPHKTLRSIQREIGKTWRDARKAYSKGEI